MRGGGAPPLILPGIEDSSGGPSTRAACGRTRGTARAPRRPGRSAPRRVARVGGDLLGDGAQLAHHGLPVPRVAQQRLDPGLRPVVLRHVVVDEQLAEHEPDPDVGERPEREDRLRARDELRRSRDAPPGAASTIAPIGSSTSGIQMSSCSLIGWKCSRSAAQPPDEVRRGDQEQNAEQPPQACCPRATRRRAPHPGRPTIDATPIRAAARRSTLPYRLLAPRPDDRRREDREQRRGLRVQLRQPEHERERRHEEDAAADAEEAGEHSAERADQRRRARSSYEQPHSDGGQQHREAVREPLRPGSAAAASSRRARRTSPGCRRARPPRP